jgi:hypothetical protein
MFDLNRTLQLVRGALLDQEPTWRSYLPEAGDWKKTACLLTVPLIVASTVIAYLIGLTSSDTSLFGQIRPTLVSSVLSMIIGGVAAAAVAFIVSFFAGMFGGKNSFALGLAATSLAFVPGYLGNALSWLPWIGALLSFGLGIWGLVLLWKIIPIYLEVPDAKRAVHYIVSLVTCVVLFFVLGTVFGGALFGAGAGSTFDRAPGAGGSGGGPGGMFGGVARQAELMAAAEEDRYEPPRDGELTDAQVQEFIRVMQRTNEAMTDKAERLNEIAEKADNDEQVSLTEVSDMMSGMTEIAGLNTAEIEVVKSGSGNWAEHQWVKNSLRTAWLQKDINDTVAHNYALYQKYEDQLAEHITR